MADAFQEPVRSSLAVLSVHNKPRAQQSSTAGAFALARPKRKATGNSGKENNGGLEIFVDDEFKPGNPEPGPLPSAPVTGLWTKLGGFEQNRQVLRCSLSLRQSLKIRASRAFKPNLQGIMQQFHCYSAWQSDPLHSWQLISNG